MSRVVNQKIKRYVQEQWVRDRESWETGTGMRFAKSHCPICCSWHPTNSVNLVLLALYYGKLFKCSVCWCSSYTVHSAMCMKVKVWTTCPRESCTYHCLFAEVREAQNENSKMHFCRTIWTCMRRTNKFKYAKSPQLLYIKEVNSVHWSNRYVLLPGDV